jgi:hypothetical protein
VLCAPAGFFRILVWPLTQARQFRRHARHVMMVVMTMVNANLHLYATYRFRLDAVNPGSGLPGNFRAS